MEESIRRKDRLAAVGRVAAGLAHEIRNPLGAMRGAIQVLESSTPPNSVQSGLMSIILSESDRLNSIITNFLNYARPKAGSFTDVDVCEAINDTVTLLKHGPDFNEKLKLDLNVPGQPVIVHADSTQLKQIFWNLARNAFQAMPDGGRLLIGLTRMRTSRIRIAFEDTGSGMSPEQVEQLFEPFANSTNRRHRPRVVDRLPDRTRSWRHDKRAKLGGRRDSDNRRASREAKSAAASSENADAEAPINEFLKVRARKTNFLLELTTYFCDNICAVNFGTAKPLGPFTLRQSVTLDVKYTDR